MKKRIFIGLVLALLVVCGVIIFGVFNKPESKVFSFVKDNKSNLEQLVKDVDKKKESKSNKYKLDEVYETSDDYMVQFSYDVNELITSGKYYGYYYSKEDRPHSFQNQVEKLSKVDENTWEWKEKGSDNGGRTRRICKNWFYYEAWF